ncbi:MAG: hypothetical protein H7336_02690 [Bacteriovorax sp.]|nr:hypothetical protein [Bacteriovorax sp.]
MKNVEILDCTLRDGSYLINFQFNTNDTHHISKLLEKSGIKYIEVGHGLGLDATDKTSSLESDIDYIKAAKQAVTKSKIGVFYIPGIGNMDSIKRAVDAGLDFIRIGVNVTEYKNAEETINYAKGLGLEVWINLMKTYTVDFTEWRNICEYLKTMKCDHLAVVDSAGGMLPADVKKYCEIAKEVTPFGIGFHGHNNMQLAIANCMAAVEGGATFVDGTLFGMGRSGGNANTEILAAIFNREGIITTYDSEFLIEIANEIIAPIARKNPGDGAVELAAGVNYFHSSFFSTVKKTCDETNTSIFRTIINLPTESRKSVSKEMVSETVKKISKNTEPLTRLKESNTLYINNITELSKYLKEVSSKTNCKIAVSVSLEPKLTESFRVSNIYTLEEMIVGHIEFSDFKELSQLMDSLKKLVNFWVLDTKLKESLTQLPELPYYFYDEELLEINTLRNELMNSNRTILTSNNLNKLAADNSYSSNGVNSEGNILVINQDTKEINNEVVKQLSKKDQILLTHKCQISDESWEIIKSKEIDVRRVNYTLSLAYEIKKIIRLKDLVESRGHYEKDGLEVVSGGIVSKKGAIIVDNSKNPTIILGITDGQGGVNIIDSKNLDLIKIREAIFAETK